MIELRNNKPNIVIRVFTFFGVIAAIYLLLLMRTHDPNKPLWPNDSKIYHPKNWELFLLYFMIVFLVLFDFICIYTLFSITKVYVDENEEIITCIWLTGRKLIAVKDITEFFETFHRNGYKKWGGLLIKLNDNTEIQLAGQNLLDIPELTAYLHARQIKCMGRRRMKFPFN